MNSIPRPQAPSVDFAPPPFAPCDRRGFLGRAAAVTAGAVLPGWARGAERDWSGQVPTRYPDPDIVALDPRFTAKLGNTPIQRLYHHPDMLWAEGPAWNGVGRYLVWSDIPTNRQLRWLEEDGHVSTLRQPSQNSNGNTFDFQGRQISCEHLTRRVTRYEPNGTVTVLAEAVDGKGLNGPNDAVVHPNGDIWFTDPGYGSLMNYEGARAVAGSVQPYQKEAVYVIDGQTGRIERVTDEIYKPNGLCFSPDYKKLYVADTGGSHYPDAPKVIKVWDVDGRKLKRGREFASMKLKMPDGTVKAGFADGIRSDTEGNIWAGMGWVGAGYDGVHVFAGEDGQRIGQILLPEICSNVCFGGTKRNRLFMTASTSLYAVYVETQGAHLT
ncbi:MAG: SMP-30/gluconolactonase/LRE family protein [Opitutaceae bacterium]